jgi:TetR/AcrR family transcriptional regulator, transcriptional repressor for nem operon
MDWTKSASQILDIAERRMRQAGYNSVSYRDVAAEIGIKSASLHYHFPKKEDLGVALVQRYSAAFKNRLYERCSVLSDPRDRIASFVDIYRYALKDQQLVCLCAVLGAEAPGLPPAITAEVKSFFQANITWLAATYAEAEIAEPSLCAVTTLSLLEGAMIVSSVNDDLNAFEAAATLIQSGLAVSSR